MMKMTNFLILCNKIVTCLFTISADSFKKTGVQVGSSVSSHLLIFISLSDSLDVVEKDVHVVFANYKLLHFYVCSCCNCMLTILRITYCFIQPLLWYIIIRRPGSVMLTREINVLFILRFT